jgi:hypothetical protein
LSKLKSFGEEKRSMRKTMMRRNGRMRVRGRMGKKWKE